MKSQEFIRGNWYADIYEQQIADVDDINFLLEMLAGEPKRVLEIACGGGRILVPLAQAGHEASGIDFDEHMLGRIEGRAQGLANIYWRKADIVKDDYGEGFDVAVLAGNILLNIMSDIDNKQAQKLVIEKAARCVKPGGYVYIDFCCFDDFTDDGKGWTIFEGTDSLGTYGRYLMVPAKADVENRYDYSRRRLELTPAQGEPFTYEYVFPKYFAKLSDVQRWLLDAGCTIEALYGGYDRKPVRRGESRIIIWARTAA